MRARRSRKAARCSAGFSISRSRLSTHSTFFPCIAVCAAGVQCQPKAMEHFVDVIPARETARNAKPTPPCVAAVKADFTAPTCRNLPPR